MTQPLTSCASVLSLLEEDEDSLKIHALRRLDFLVDEFWAEISDNIEKIEILYESESFPERELAALIASKVYYHLEEFTQAMNYALGAGSLFDIGLKTPYNETLLSKFIDEYIRLRHLQCEDPKTVIEPRLENMLTLMFERSYQKGEFKQAIGIAVEARLIDKVEEAVVRSGSVELMLSYCLTVCVDLIPSREFRREFLWRIIKMYQKLPQPDYIIISQCYVTLEYVDGVFEILKYLLLDDFDCKESLLLAYQIAFDLSDGATQHFRASLKNHLAKLIPPIPIPPKVEDETGDVPTLPKVEDETGDVPTLPKVKDETGDVPTLPKVEDETGDVPTLPIVKDETGDVPTLPKEKETRDVEMEVNEGEAGDSDMKNVIEGCAGDSAKQDSSLPEQSPRDAALSDRINTIFSILSGETSIQLFLEFMYRNNNTDMSILTNLKQSSDSRNSVRHSAIIMANAFIHAGTTSDVFLRENLEWLGRATNWARFTATAGLGMIHKGHLKEALRLLSPYLPQNTAFGSSPYSEGGAFYALGLIFANHGTDIVGYLKDALCRSAGFEVLQHGACLGLGIAAMGTGSEQIYEMLKTTLYTDSAVAGEASALSMGLVMLGTADDNTLQEMLTYAHETQHEKIIRALALGMALVMTMREEGADTLIEQLCGDKDALLRYGGMFAIGLAYCGTSNHKAIQKLLHVAVSDVSDDVRRAAVMCLGLVLFRQPLQCVRMVSLLTQSYNPHVRYGATLALGIACAGTALTEAIDMLEPLTVDPTDYVRQGALIALSMILVQANDVQQPKVAKIREIFKNKIEYKHEDTMSIVGAILGTGFLNAGGRNVTISLTSLGGGYVNMSAIVGMAIFCQYWYWYPYLHFISLAFKPTALIGLDKELKVVPEFSCISNAKPSLFAYPPKTKLAEKKSPQKVATAVLSFTKKKSEKEKEEQARAEKEKEDKEKEEKEKEKLEREKEPDFSIIKNSTRVTVPQLKYISFDPNNPYIPVKKKDVFGIAMLKDTRQTKNKEKDKE